MGRDSEFTIQIYIVFAVGTIQEEEIIKPYWLSRYMAIIAGDSNVSDERVPRREKLNGLQSFIF